MKIAKYSLVKTNFLEDFLADVNEKIEEGYQPFGSICVSSTIDEAQIYVIYAQAMVMYQ